MSTVTLTEDEYCDLVDARDHAIAMRDVGTGAMPTLSEAELDAYLAAPSPLAFWRKHRAMTQAALAEKVGLTQPHIAQAERGERGLSIGAYSRLAKVLRVRIEDLLPPEEGSVTMTADSNDVTAPATKRSPGSPRRRDAARDDEG